MFFFLVLTRCSLPNAETACQLWFLSTVWAMQRITESLWCCPLWAAVASAENLLGPQWRKRRRGEGGLDGAEGGLCVSLEGAYLMRDWWVGSWIGSCVKNIVSKLWVCHCYRPWAGNQDLLTLLCLYRGVRHRWSLLTHPTLNTPGSQKK